MLNKKEKLHTLLPFIFLMFLSTFSTAQTGQFDVRMLIDSIDCTTNKLFIDIQVRADNPGEEFYLGDQNYRFSFTRNVLANPALVQELDVTGYIVGGPGPAGFSFYSPHTLTGSLDTIVSYNLELQGGDGIFVTDTNYINVGRMSLDILDYNTPVCLRWHRDIPVDFPNTFVGQKFNGNLIPTNEGSYLDYYQDLSSACNNTAPAATNDTGTTPEEQPITVCLPTNDTDPENALDSTSVTLLTTPPASEGTVVLDSLTGCITFTPTADFNGTVTAFDYQICDLGVLIPSYHGDNNPNPIPAPDAGDPPIQSQPPACITATVNLTVTPVNDAPVAVDDTETTLEDTPLNSDVLPNDSDIDGDPLTVTTTPVTAPTNGTVTLNANGTYTYTPNPGYNGTDSFEYEVCDSGTPQLCDTAIVNISIGSVNDPPVAVDDNETTPEDTPLNANVLTNDSDPENDNLTVTTTPVTPPANGTLTLNANGTYTYTPNADFSGTDSFEYEVCDDGSPVECSTAIVNITITPANDAPVATDDTGTTSEDTPLNGTTVLTNDTDIDTGNVLTATTTPVTAPTNGTVTISSTGTYVYTPNPDFNGTDTFEYEVCDNGTPQLCDNAVVTITITPVNDAPVAVDDSGTTPEDTPLNGTTVLSNDTDVDTGDVLTATTTPVTAPTNGTVTISPTGTYVYTPNADFNGTDSFEYEVCDNGSPALCDIAVVNITITPANDTPVAVDDTNITTEDTPVSGDVSPNDSDIDGDPLTVNTTPTAAPTNGTVALNANGTYAYTPNPDFNGTDSFRYEICDNGSPALCDEATVTITMTPVNDPPVANDDVGTTPEDTPFNGPTVLSNDTDVDTGDVLTATTTPIANPTNGTVTINPDGTYTYTPNMGFNGSDTFEYEVCDNSIPQLCDIATVTITIDDVNDQPTALDDTDTTPEDTPLNGIDLLANDTDIDGNNLTITTTPVTSTTNGTLVINANGTYTYTPNPEFNGTDTFEYEVCDDGVNPNMLCDTATVTITVTPVNDAPIATDDSGTTPEDTPLSGTTVLSNDTDIDTGDVLAATTTPVTAPTNGTVTISPTGTYVYTPNADFNGTDSFEYEVCDSGTPKLCDIAVVNITVTPVNDAPIAVDDTGTTPEDTPLSGTTVLSNDTDIDTGDVLTATTTPVTAPTNGTVTISSTGTYVYTPNADFNGADTFEYEVCDNGTPQLCDIAVVNITVTPGNDAPIATDDTGTTPEDTPLNGTTVLSNDTDIDTGDVLTATTTPVTSPTNGTVTISSTGTYVYTPNADFNGTDTFEYEVCDNDTPQLCDIAVVTITVTPVNDAPVATDDTGTTPEDTPLNGTTILSNDTDIDTGDVLTATTTPVTAPTNGTVTISSTGTYVYTPNADFNGTDSFEYEVCDNGTPQLCDIAVVNITVTPGNDTPVAVDDINTTTEDTPVSGNVSPNDSDIDGDPLTVNTTPTAAPTNGTVVLNANGTYTYTPNPDFNGTDSFRYQICDNGSPALCDEATVTITVTPVNDAPIANDDFGTTPEDTPFNGPTVLSNDTDVDTGDVLTVTTTPTTNPVNGTVTINANGTYTYTPNTGFNGSDTFEYEVCDDGTPQLCDIATVTVTIDNVNDQPTALDDVDTTPEDTPLNGIDLLANDTDIDGNNLTITTTPVVGTTNGTLVINANGTYTYTPNPDFNGTDTFEYEVCDDGINPNMLCDTATVTITVTPVNDAPIATDDSGATTEDTPLSGTTVLTNDTDVDTGDILAATTTPVTPPANGTVTINPDGTYVYTPNVDFNGTDSFEYEVCDSGTPQLCDMAVVTITVTPVNDAPVATDDAETTAEDTPLSSDVLPNDNDADGDPLTLTTTPVTAPANGTVTLNPNGTYTYTPNADFNGTDSFEYEICDNGSPALCDVATVNITITPVNDAPVAVDDSETTSENTPITSDVTPNDSDVDGDPLTVNTTPLSGPSNGTLTLNPNGTYTYTPNAGYSGLDMFEYEICDNGSPALCDIAQVTISVGAVNDPPVAVDDNETTPEDTPITSDVLTNDSDIDTGDILTVNTIPVTNVTNGTLALNSNGTYTYTPNPNFFGTDTFVYEVCDNGIPVLCSTATVTITVTSVNDAPIAVNDSETTNENAPVSSDVSLNDSDADVADILTVTTTPVTNVSNGTLVLNSDGTYTYTPNAGYNGLDTFEYEICDNGSPVLCDIAMVTISIGAVNDPPTAVDDNETTPEDTPLNADVLTNDSDLDGDNLTVTTTPVVAPTNGTLVLNANGTYTYTPNPDFFGTDSFAYEVCDDGTPSLCSTAIVNITITPVNDAPVAVDDSANTPENTPVSSDVSPNDSDTEAGTLTYSVVTSTSNGTLVLNPDGTYTYTPNAGFFGTDTFTYEVCDADTPQLCDTAVVTITVISSDDPPIASNDVGFTNEDIPLNSTLAANDNEPDGENLIYTTTPIAAPTNGTVVINPDGTYTYTPNPNFSGIDNFTYEVCDDVAPILCTTAVATIRINSVNDLPDLGNDQTVTDELVPVDIDVVANDSDVEDGAIDPCSVTIVTQPMGGTVTFGPAPACVLTYTPNSGFSGTDVFEYEVCDSNGSCSNALVDITVNPICLDVQLGVWLEGPMALVFGNGYLPSMRSDLNVSRSVLPGEANSNMPSGQPYSAAPWNYFGTEGVGWTDSDYQNFEAANGGLRVVDWVLVSFRTGLTASTTFKKAAAMVFENGSVAFPDPCVLSISSPTMAYVVIEHRNHMGVMSDVPVAIANGQFNYDFRIQDSYNNTSFGQKQIFPGQYAMYAGDISQVGDLGSYDINGDDKIPWEPENGKFSHYSLTDTNLDGDTNGADKALWFNNFGFFSGVPR